MPAVTINSMTDGSMTPVGAKVRGNGAVDGAAVGTKVGMSVLGNEEGSSVTVVLLLVEFVSSSLGRKEVEFEGSFALVVESGVATVVDAEIKVGGSGVAKVPVGATAGSVGGVISSIASWLTSLCEDCPPSRRASDTATPIKQEADKKNSVETKTNNLSHRGERRTQYGQQPMRQSCCEASVVKSTEL